jgi:PTH1 family peptidyl-tRNA hydrolase
MKIKDKGGHGGHKGVQSIIEQLGSADFLRVKIGIGKPPQHGEGTDYVLSPFAAEERALIKEGMEQAAAAVKAIIVSGKDKAMTVYN